MFENISDEEEDEKEIKKREQQEKKEKRKREREEKRKEAAEKKKKTGLRTGRLSKYLCRKYMVVRLALMTFNRQYTQHSSSYKLAIFQEKIQAVIRYEKDLIQYNTIQNTFSLSPQNMAA